jgi:hypothetical protein
MLATSGALLIFGFWQIYRRGSACQRRSRLSQAVFWVCAVLVLAIILMPQIVASLLAGGIFLHADPTVQPPLAGMSVEALKTQFNWVSPGRCVRTLKQEVLRRGAFCSITEPAPGQTSAVWRATPYSSPEDNNRLSSSVPGLAKTAL